MMAASVSVMGYGSEKVKSERLKGQGKTAQVMR
jgi:hypothetical protein